MKQNQVGMRLLFLLNLLLIPANMVAILTGFLAFAVPSGTIFDIFLDFVFQIAFYGNIIVHVVIFLGMARSKIKIAQRLWFLMKSYMLFFLGATLFYSIYAATVAFEIIIPEPFRIITALITQVFHIGQYTTGIVLNWYSLRSISKNRLRNAIWISNSPRTRWADRSMFSKLWHSVSILFVVICMVSLIYITIVFTTGLPIGVAMAAGEIAGNFFLLGIFICVFLIRAYRISSSKKGRAATTILFASALVLSVVTVLPWAGTFNTIASLDDQFSTTFGSSWNNGLRSPGGNELRASPIYFKDNLIAELPPEVEVIKNIAYTTGINRTLMFDWYAPVGTKDSSSLLPLVISIHGGGWNVGDKGELIPVLKKIANIGFVVVDIQYSLFHEGGTFSEMIREIGNLTVFLETHGEYNADLSRTFFTGRSAGGHLSLVCGLGCDNSTFSGNFSSQLDVKGIIAYYPPTNFSLSENIRDEYLSLSTMSHQEVDIHAPIHMVNPTSPPVLIYQGEVDKLVIKEHAYNFKSKMDEYNNTMLLGLFPYAGHAFDALVNTYYAQACQYYTERFLSILA
mgnify:CR=1 FL=1